MKAPAIRVLIVDDHELIRVGLKRVLVDGLSATVHEVATGRAALEALEASPWDLIVLDLSLPDTHGLDLLKQLKELAPTTPVLVLTILPEEQVAVAALRHGADGFVSKSSAARDLIAAAQLLLAGGKYVSPVVTRQLVQGLRGTPDARHAALSEREQQVFRALVGGQTVTQIAQTMGLSVKTISSYRVNALRKLNLENNAQLIAYAHRHGLV
jgi:DNA-binding NarL/FixJ family response regulator